MITNRWTVYIKFLRVNNRYTLRKAAEGLHVSAPYLHDVEVGTRQPTRKLIESMINFYCLDANSRRILYDAAAEVLGCIPFDVEDFLKNNPDALNAVIGLMDVTNNKMGSR